MYMWRRFQYSFNSKVSLLLFFKIFFTLIRLFLLNQFLLRIFFKIFFFCDKVNALMKHKWKSLVNLLRYQRETFKQRTNFLWLGSFLHFYFKCKDDQNKRWKCYYLADRCLSWIFLAVFFKVYKKSHVSAERKGVLRKR